MFKLPLGKIFLASGLVWQALKAGFSPPPTCLKTHVWKLWPLLSFQRITIKIKHVQIPSNLSKLVQTCPKWIKNAQIGSNISKLDSICPNRFSNQLKLVQIGSNWSNWCKLFQKASNLSRMGETLTRLVQTCSKWIELARSNSNLSKLVQPCQILSNLSKLVQTCPNWFKYVYNGLYLTKMD